jgi:hypothetical protein
MPSSRRFRLLILLVAACLLAASRAHAETIRSNLLGPTTSASGFWGQSVVTGDGGPWNELMFNFYTSMGPRAFGNIFLLGSEYLGLPTGLSAALPGYIAHAAAIDNVYVFDPSVTIEANTRYFFYTDTLGVINGNISSGIPGENHYYAKNSSSTFNGPKTGANFLLQGSVAETTPVPEPGSLTLLACGLTGLCLMRRRRA